MANERTFSIVKPNAVHDNNIGNILSRFEAEGLRLAASKFASLSKEKAEGFYIEHKERPFFWIPCQLYDFWPSSSYCS